MEMSLEYVNRLLATLPSGAAVDISFRGVKRTNRLMARDMPGTDRRFTNLDTGGEWFLPLSANLGVTSVSVCSMDIELIP